VSLELGLSAGIMTYIQAGVTDAWRPLTAIR
jgi:hypothetical protein